MREIKFRAWDKDRKEWVEDDDFYVHSLTDKIHWADNPSGNYARLFPFENNIELMQYTGLKDKSGVEIYEGDVLIRKGLDYKGEEFQRWEKSGYEGDEPTHIEIKRDYCTLESFRYWLENESFGYEGEELEDPTEWEIIGNIYENPELLK